jgi:hypothetical protein
VIVIKASINIVINKFIELNILLNIKVL